jgi:endonuclease/exonuclease/phosphatase family metal-dependent hydrolase
MPFYSRLKYRFRGKSDRARVIGNLQKLRRQLDRDVPAKDADGNLILASWNIRDFGKPGSRRGFGKREPESFFYIAEILSRFDLIAVQEVNELPEWDEVMNILGPDWDYIATDETDRALGGNGERLTYCFDKRKVQFKNIAGEIVLPAKMLISSARVEMEDGEKLYTGKQFRRTPFVTSFQSGWFKFDICTVHLYYGAESGAKLQERIEEIGAVAKYFGKRADKDLNRNKALILLGDFNIVHPKHKTMKALVDNGFKVPKTLAEPTNFVQTKFYDQIAFKTKPTVLDYIERSTGNLADRNAGVLNIHRNLYTPSQWKIYKAQMRKSPSGKNKSNADLQKYYKQWLTYQLSDHKPLWVRINTNDSAAYLDRLKKEALE